MKLQGRNAIITGASQGLGAEIATHFVREGANVMLCARNDKALAEQAEKLFAEKVSANQRIETCVADVADTQQVDTLFATAIEKFGALQVVVNNAGVYGPMGPSETVDWVEWAQAININLLGTVYPCRLAVEHFRAQGYGKIINLSGGGATNPLPFISSYAASKAAVVRFTESLALEVKDVGIDINAVAPGALVTNMMDQLIAAGPETVGAAFYERMQKIAESGGTPLHVGASLCVYLASAESDGVTGKLLAAQWDPWPFSDTQKQELDKTDIFALRRIVPPDRGQNWDQ